MSILEILTNGKIQPDSETEPNEYTVRDSKSGSVICVTPYRKVAEVALDTYISEYLN